MPKSDETQEPPFSSDWTKSAYASSIGETASSGQSLSAPTRGGVIWPVTLALLAIEASGGLALLALFKKGDQTFPAFLPTSAGFASVVAIAVLMGAIGYLFKVYSKTKLTGRREFHLTVVMNLMTVLVATVSAECAIRILATETREGPAINGMLLLPRSWNQVSSHYQRLVERAEGDLSYQIYDPYLGWRIGPSRRSANGLYFSDDQGIRAAKAGVHSDASEGKRLIAVLGDSFAFGEEVAYGDTWPVQLERLMGPEFKVMNFGVPGYGVDQIFLRYVREVVALKPDVLIFSFITHDLLRSMMVYSFLSLPEWDMPFSKPRLILSDETLQPLNVPTIPPSEIFAKAQIFDLPYLVHDSGYAPLQWQSEFYQRSYLVRFLLSRFPRWPQPNLNETDDAILSLNKQILRSFIDKARGEGSTAVLVYLPTSEDFRGHDRRVSLGMRLLQATGIQYADPTFCLAKVPSTERFVGSTGHYSPSGNKAVAECLFEQLRGIT